MGSSRPGVLIISGLDPTGGAGFAADVRLVERWGGRPAGIVTGLTVQDTQGVRSAEVMSPEYVSEQLLALLSDVQVRAVKVGMLGNAEMARAVAAGLSLTDAAVVWDPVVTPSHGTASLLATPLTEAVEILRDHVTLITPNLDEASALVSYEVNTVATATRAAQEIETALGVAVLVTGGHLPGAPVDVLSHRGDVTEIVGQRVAGPAHIHGTGCALSTSIACGLARGFTLSEACVAACGQVRGLLADAPSPGRGYRAVI